MRMKFLPKSRYGLWSVGLNTFFLISSISLYIFGELLDAIPSEILISVIGTISIIASIVGLITGTAAVIKNRERSMLVFLSIIIGFGVLSFIITSIIIDI